jgi:hypothetical protein
MNARSRPSRAEAKPGHGATGRTPSPPGLHRRPRLSWQTLKPGEAVTPAELESDVVGVLVRVLEWAAHAGVNFQQALRRARDVETERLQGGRPMIAALDARESTEKGRRH